MADLCALADVKAWLQTGQNPYPPTDDALLARTITACSAFIESWLARPIGLANWQEIRYGKGGEHADRLPLAATPVVNILSLTIDGFPIPAQPPLTATSRYQAGYFFTPTELWLRGYCFARHSRIIVQYTAGYAPIPADVQQVCIEMVVRKYRERTRIAERSRSLGGAETVAYETLTFAHRDLMSDIQALLQQYRQVAMLPRPTLLSVLPTGLVLEDQTTPIEAEDQATPIVAEP